MIRRPPISTRTLSFVPNTPPSPSTVYTEPSLHRDRRTLLLHQRAVVATEERAMRRRMAEGLERSEPRGLPAAQRERGAATGADKNLRALFPVDEEMAR